MSLLVLPFTIFTNFSAPAGLYRQLVRPSMNLLALPFFTNFSAPAGVYRLLVRQSMNLTDLPFSHFTAFSAPADLYCQLSHRPMNLLDVSFYHSLPILAPLHVYTSNQSVCQRRYWLYQFVTIYTSFTPSVNESTGFTILPLFTNFSAAAGLYRQWACQSMNIPDLPFLTVLPQF